MSVKNKAKDRDQHGRIKRKYTGPYPTEFTKMFPKWWRTVYMNKPKRRAHKKLLEQIRLGKDPDGLVGPLGNHKPHEWYW